jgi:hypothetical protein
MRVFISWSGERSQRFAHAVHQWLQDVNSMIEPWMSAADIEAGERWSPAIDTQLAETSVGILCLTRDNLTAPWLLFEAGALAKSVQNSRVCPLLLDLKPTDMPAGPLTRFQAKRVTREGVFDILETINNAMQTGKLTDLQLQRVFDRWWPDLEAAVAAIPPKAAPAASLPSEKQMLREILDHVRGLARKASETEVEPEYEVKTIRARPMRIRRGLDGKIHIIEAPLSSDEQKIPNES